MLEVFVGMLLLGGLVGGLIYHMVFVRTIQPAQRRADIKWQLAVAKARHEQRVASAGPMFPRAAMHVNRIAERAQLVLQEMETAEWKDHARKQWCVEEMSDLLRHAEELTKVMTPRRRFPL